MNTATAQQAQSLRERYTLIKAENPKARIRNVAEQMGVTELELVAAQCGDIKAQRLKEPAQDILKELGALGRVMALTRNEWAVHERHGRYEDVRAGKTMGIALGPDIDLRLFFSVWKSVWAVDDGGRKSLQFFDMAGGALHKVYVTDETDTAAYEALVARFVDPQAEWPEIESLPPVDATPVTEAPAALRADWLAMQDTHEFFGLLKKHQVSRLTALRGVGPDLAQQMPNDLAERMITDVAGQSIPFMCFVGNRGIVQIHSGPIAKTLRTGPWFNILEPHFNLHLNTDAIDATWIVNRPTSDGWVTSLECFAANGDLIAQFFGARKPGVPELTSWRELLAGYCTEPLAA
ncbi:hemin-degrading factor [Allopusillimonas soli]|uniref:Hemin-degrading factor n=1 Tax=Allopusillimonas soli TaxID=659016 RepID=A0A853FGN1_9BURK|nr:ChuX/HutX family heme-like substrate-binding protein [Allopusillimonas soli]NYT39037.1 hemin-degrading factor [Allopusillimonas soli]TEA69529.1 hemin-degrading factor [Allopusillimonas soli]